MSVDGQGVGTDKQGSKLAEPVPVANAIELVVLVKFWIKRSLAMDWRHFLEGEPVDGEREKAIWSRLAVLLVALGWASFDDAMRQACREFFLEVDVLATDDETRRVPREIFLFGDHSQRHAAGLLVRSYRNHGDRGYRDKRLREIRQRVKQGDQGEIPREIRCHVERIRREQVEI